MQEIVTILVSIPDKPLPTETAAVLSKAGINWTLIDSDERPLKPSDLIGSHGEDGNVLQVADRLESAGFAIKWRSDHRQADRERNTEESSVIQSANLYHSPFDWPKHLTILAVVPHWKCDRWLKRCLQSLSDQTHPLTNIVVINDGFNELPLEIVRAFPQVTLLSSPLRRQVGPYRLVQSVISRVDYTAFLFQDADDWSSCDRLQTLLYTARAHSADIVGSPRNSSYGS